MQEYNSPEEYIKDVQRYIRWSRAKVVATRELSDHINDQYDALRENGLNQKEAMRKAIEEMGDADVVGTELDIVHRPKVNWLLLLIAGVLLLSFDICMKLCLAIIQPFFKIYRSHFATVLTVAAVSAALLTEQRRIKSGRDFLHALIR